MDTHDQILVSSRALEGIVVGIFHGYTEGVMPATRAVRTRLESDERRIQMGANMSALQIMGIVLSGMVGGAGLLMLLIGWLSSSMGDEGGSGCLAVGLVLLGAAAYAALRIVTA